MKTGFFPDDYQFPDDFPPWRWAWEFLRRNPEYRADWERWLGLYPPENPTEKEEPDFAIRARSGVWDHDFEFPEKECLRKWWLKPGYVNPDVGEPIVAFARTFGAVSLGGPPGRSQVPRGYVEGVRGGADEPNRFVAYAEFDLTIPVGSQIADVEKDLKDIQDRLPELTKARPKLHRKLLPFYLFLLDSAELGPTAIANSFTSDPTEPDNADSTLDAQKVRERLNAAGRLTEPSGYLSLLY